MGLYQNVNSHPWPHSGFACSPQKWVIATAVRTCTPHISCFSMCPCCLSLFPGMVAVYRLQDLLQEMEPGRSWLGQFIYLRGHQSGELWGVPCKYVCRQRSEVPHTQCSWVWLFVTFWCCSVMSTLCTHLHSSALICTHLHAPYKHWWYSAWNTQATRAGRQDEMVHQMYDEWGTRYLRILCSWENIYPACWYSLYAVLKGTEPSCSLKTAINLALHVASLKGLSTTVMWCAWIPQ